MDEKRRHPAIVPHGTALPPPAPGVRHVPVALVGIVISDDDLRQRVDRFFHWPMIVLALAILPLLAIEVYRSPHGPLQWAIEIGFAVIWLAFVIEFVIKITIAECRLEYIRRNWLDIVIILVPLLRPLRAFRATQGLARTTRVFKMRGVGMKCARYIFTVIVGLKVTDDLLHKIGLKARDERQDPAKMTRDALMREVTRLRRRNDAWEQWHEAHERYVRQRGGACYLAPRPRTDEAADDEPPLPDAAVDAPPPAQ
ncbi:MAG: ion transporter [Planctomycetota bacterium]|jgi:hypothetical protein